MQCYYSLFLSFKKRMFITIAIAVGRYQHFCTSFLSPNPIGEVLYVSALKTLHKVHKGTTAGRPIPWWKAL